MNKKVSGIIFDTSIQQEIFKHRRYKPCYLYKDEYFMTRTFAKFLNSSNIKFLERIDYYFDNLFVDEVQDFSSDDLDWICNLSSLDIPVTLVGDFYQQTYFTSNRENKNKGIKLNKNRWINNFMNYGFNIDENSLIFSRRCGNEICEFVRNKLKINIYSKKESNKVDIGKVLFVSDKNKISEIINDNAIIKLFYQKSDIYNCNSMNWGASKGLTFDNVCVVLNPTTFKLYKKENGLNSLANTTKSKLYVACTRSKGNLYFIDQNKISDKFYLNV